MSIKLANKIFKNNYLQELPEDIKILIYNYVYKDNFSIVLNEFLTNLNNMKHYYNLKHFLVYQEEPKLNLLHFLSQNIYTHKVYKYREDSILSLYKKHLISNNNSKTNISKIKILKIPTNLFKSLDKIIAKTFVKFMNKSTNNWDISYNIYIDEVCEYFVLEYDRHFLCFADFYLMLLSFWQFIRIKLYEFYKIHKDAYNIYITSLLKSDYDSGLYIWFCGNITDDVLINNLVKMKNDNASLYRKIIRQRNNISKSERMYLNFELRNNIDSFVIDKNTIIIRLKEII